MVVEANARAARALSPAFGPPETRGLASAPNTPDPDVVAERLIGELFGWEFSRNGPSRERASAAIFPELIARYLAGDPVSGSFPELAPSPAVNRCLGRLVAIARCEFDSTPTKSGLRSPLAELEVRERILARIQAEPELRSRAASLRHFAAISETALEHHHGARLLARLRAAAVPPAPAPHGPQRMQRLIACLTGFPYVASYAHLVSAELALLEAQVAPVFVRDRELWRLDSEQRAALGTQIEACAVALRALPLRQDSLAVCGCGPLPISGLMLHAWTGARVRLIDIDRSSIECCAEWIVELERLGVLSAGAVTVELGDAADPSVWTGARHDAVLIASLVPSDAKQRAARAIAAAAGGRTPALLLRSAAGLCAELAYEAVPTAEISSIRLPFCGESVPAHLVVDLDAKRAAQRGVTARSSRELIAIANESVLNTTELYYALPAPTGSDRSGVI